MTFIVNLLITKYNVIYFDQRGTGNSNNKSHHVDDEQEEDDDTNPDRDYSIESYIKDIDVIMEHFGVCKFHIFGHSWGGLYAQVYADVYPQNKILSIFLCSPSSGTNTTWIQCENEVLKYNQSKSTIWEFIQMGYYSLLGGVFNSDNAYQKMFLLVIQNYNKGYKIVGGEGVDDTDLLQCVKADPINLTRPNIVKYKQLDTMENPQFPILVTYGKDNDIYGPSREEVYPKRYPKTASTKFIQIENSGHLPWLHNPKCFTEILQEFYQL